MDDDDCLETDNNEGEKVMGESHEIRIRLTKKMKRMLKYVGFQVNADPDSGFSWPKSEKFYSWKKSFFSKSLTYSTVFILRFFKERPSCRRSFCLQKRTSSTSNMKFLYWIRLDLDSDPADKNQCGSGPRHFHADSDPVLVFILTLIRILAFLLSSLVNIWLKDTLFYFRT